MVHERQLSQQSLSNALANGRNIVGHFKHLPLATAWTLSRKISKCQPNVCTKTLLQDGTGLLEKTISVLAPFEEPLPVETSPPSSRRKSSLKGLFEEILQERVWIVRCAASNIIDARRNRLGERAEILIFLKKNLPSLLKL
ncbi:hypothetical protein N1851_006455 [Merluccius polli]|uniref:Uncharacterized protein n=1 Tax=Merluccius polli TaxID=89951 RepID=A0AA47P8I5_MERPO|nr:hypothetical protein N1851_006455 [Merluccius polli]